MRITNKMMINNAKYWLSKQTERLSKAETISASGKQVNKPSDDPTAAAAILEYRSDISRYEQYGKSLTQTSTLVEVGEEVYDAVDDLLNQARDIATELASGKSDYTETYLSTLQGIYDSILDLANTTCSGNYLYSGNITNSCPFSNEISLTLGEDVDFGYYVTSSAAEVTITIYDTSGQEVRTITNSGTEGSNIVTWDGLDNAGTSLASGTYTFSISAADSSGNIVASSCYQGDSGNRQVLISDSTTATINSNGGDIFTKTLSALTQLINSFEAGTTEETADEVTETFNSALDRISYERVALSNIYSLLNLNLDKIEKATTLLENKLSEIENGNTTEFAVNLTAQETAYEITTEAVAKILNLPKLSDYV